MEGGCAGAGEESHDHRHLVRDGHGRHGCKTSSEGCSCRAPRASPRRCRGGLEHPAPLNDGRCSRAEPSLGGASARRTALGAAEGALNRPNSFKTHRDYTGAKSPTSRRCRSRLDEALLPCRLATALAGLGLGFESCAEQNCVRSDTSAMRRRTRTAVRPCAAVETLVLLRR